MDTNSLDAFKRAQFEFRRDNWIHAEKLCHALLGTSPDHYDALNLLGTIAAQNRQPVEAVKWFSRASEIAPRRIEALGNLGNVLQDLNRHDEALAYFDRALEIEPGNAQLHCNRGIILCGMGRRDEGMNSYLQALRLDPQHGEARWNLALLHLQQGNMADGWAGHELRWEVTRDPRSKPRFPQPLWLGQESLSGKTILLHAEAGLGDTLQFCRYAELVARLGAQTVVALPPTLLALVKNVPGVHHTLVTGDALPPFDYHCPLMSLPLAFKTSLQAIPANIPYVFSDPSRVSAWRQRLGTKTKPRVGLVWSGNPGHKNDHNRSIPLGALLPLLEYRAIEWFSLHKEVRESDQACLDSRPDIRHFGGELHDFSDTAALVELMDIVISVDSGVAHLAGAMGRPVWILLPLNPDWRWLLGRENSPWYPTARLFRQSTAGDWVPVVQAVNDALEHSNKSAPPISRSKTRLTYLFVLAALVAISTYLLVR